MVFAAEGRAGLGQCEALMGITPGGGAIQYLSYRMTRGRALEVILGADLIDAVTAERYGWINRAQPVPELDGFVNRLAHNIAALPKASLQQPRGLSRQLIFGKVFVASTTLGRNCSNAPQPKNLSEAD